MTNLTEYIQAIGDSYGIVDPGFMLKTSLLLVNNNWYGCHPVIENGKLMIDDEEAELIAFHISSFCEMYDSDEKEKAAYLMGEMENIMPKTANLLARYSKGNKIGDRPLQILADFLLTYLPGEMQESTDLEIGTLMDDGYNILSKVYGDMLANFINWVHVKTKTVYQNLYFMEKYADRSEESSAYDPDYYLGILYHLYNSEYIEKNDMYTRAAESRNYVDTWLFLSLHFLCALRNTDLERLPHPKLAEKPEKVLEMIADGTFPDESARAVVCDILWHLEALRLTPNKTEGTSGVGSIKFFVPESVEVHIGILFAAAEAHFQIAHEDPDKPLIRSVSRYEDIARYMGDEIGDLFLEANFRSRSANKSYLQMIYILTDEILGVNDDFHVKGYILAALARSHKGSYGDFAKTTSVYLKDAKMSGYTPELVAREVFERGVLSMVVSMLLKMLMGEEYNKLSVEGQTKLLKEVNISPEEAETSVAILQKSMNQAKKLAVEIYEHCSEKDIKEILHRIGNGEAVSKCGSCMCMMSAMGKACPFPEIQNCPGCEHEISTKMTMYLMVKEVHRLQKVFKSSESETERQRSRAIVKDVILPSMDAMLRVMDEVYGSDARKILEKIIEETE